MNRRLVRFHSIFFKWRTIVTEEFLALFLALLFIMPLSAAPMRFSDRSLFMQSTEPSVTTSYTISFQYMTSASVGSVDMLFCIDPIPYMPCVTPPGLNVSNATLSSQTGETGFSISQKSANRVVLSRLPSAIAPGGVQASYKFDNIVNSSDQTQSFAIRLKSLASTNGTGPQIDFGSIKGQVASSIVLETQVPPMLIFCAAEEVSDNCESTNGNYFTDMGDLNTNSTLTARSQMAVGTNASAGFVIYATGTAPAAATNIIDSPLTPTESQPGTNQFGINLVANTAPAIGSNPEGTWANAIPSPDYAQPDKYKYISGDVVAYSPNVSLMKKFTVSYILNAGPNLRAGMYTTTINYIASGRF
jgi:hypothetical protein